MVTETTGINAFDRKFYQAISDKAAKYHREMYSGILEAIPVKQIQFNKDSYKKPIFGASNGITGGKPSVDKAMMQTAKEHKVYDLKNVNCYLHWDDDDIMALGPQLIEQNDEQIAEWGRQASISIFKGVYSDGYNASIVGQGKKLTDGLIDQATSITNLDGTNSALLAEGDVYKALTKFVQSIPFRFIDGGGKINLLMDPLFFAMANSKLFTNDSGVTEWEQFLRFYKAGDSPYKIGKVFFSNELALDGSTDTVGTTSRLIGWINKPSILERCYSRGFGKMGPDARSIVNGVSQAWTTKLAGCVHQNEGFIYSDAITWALME